MGSEVRLFYTNGKHDIVEETWNKPDPGINEIEVKSIFTGVCRSDIDMYAGTFQLLPKTIQGHESVGIVTKVGKGIRNIKEGDYVATRGEPAFADFYNCPDRMFVKVPEASPKYIIEPVACALNIADSLQPKHPKDILLLGSGFLATIVCTSLRSSFYSTNIHVVGSANSEFWDAQPNVIRADAESIRNRKFDYIIDLSDKPEYLDLNIYNERATIVMAAEKHPAVNTTFAQFLWNAVNIKFPSPRNETFYNCMERAVHYIRGGIINVDSLWSTAYDRETEVKLAFDEGLNKPAGYSRGYIKWE